MIRLVSSVAMVGLTAAAAFAATDARTRRPSPQPSCSLAITGTPSLTVRSAEGASLFYRVTGGAIVDGGGIVVASSGTHAVLAFDSAGRLSSTFGRKGEGPGEFRFLHGLWRYDDSTLMVGDNLARRVTLFSHSLSNTRSVSLVAAPGVRWPAIIGALHGSIVAINGQAFENGQMGIGAVRPPYQFLRFTSRGALRDTVISVAGREFHVPPDHATRPTAATPFGPDVLFAIGDSGLVLLPNDGGRITRVQQRQQQVAWATFPTARRAVTPDDVARYKAAQRTEAVTPAQRRAAQQLDETPFPGYHPTATALMVDQMGSVWVQRADVQRSAWSTWEVIAPNGRSRCSTQMPSSVRLLDATRDRVLGVLTDRDGDESLVVYPIRRQ